MLNVPLKCFARQVVSRHRLPFARLATFAFKSWCRFRNTRTTHETSRQSARPFLLVTSLGASAAKISGRCAENKCNWRGVVCFVPRERGNYVPSSSHRERDEFVGGRGRNGMCSARARLSVSSWPRRVQWRRIAATVLTTIMRSVPCTFLDSAHFRSLHRNTVQAFQKWGRLLQHCCSGFEDCNEILAIQPSERLLDGS